MPHPQTPWFPDSKKPAQHEAACALAGFAGKSVLALAFVCWVFGLCAMTAFGAPLVSNVKFGMQSGTRLVDVTYDLSGGTCSIGLSVSSDNGATFAVPVKSVTGAVGNGVTSGTGKRIVWDAGTDWPGQTSSQVKLRVTAWDLLQWGELRVCRDSRGHIFDGEPDR
jgi:hypothetical protein